MMKFADPKNDLAFKKIFGDINHKNILISFLNSVLDFTQGHAIVDISLANPYQIPKIPDLKETILDIKAKNKNGDSFIIEMQKKDLGDFTKRSLYYTSKAYIEQLPKGTDYTVLKKVYFIGILNFSIFENHSYISRHLIINQETNTQDLKDFEFSFIELPKFTKELEELESPLEKWIYFIKNAGDLTVIPTQYQNLQEFQEAFTIATQTSWDIKELELYDYISLKEFDDINALRTAERKGEVRGREEGKLEIAKNLLDILDNQTIALKTGLDEEVIEGLRK